MSLLPAGADGRPRAEGPAPVAAAEVIAPTLGESFRSFFDAVDQFFTNLAAVELLPLLVALTAFTVYLTLRARASLQHPARRLPGRAIPLPRHLGRLLRRLRLQRGHPGARRRRRAPVPHQDLGAASRATRRWRLELRRRAGLRPGDRLADPGLRLHARGSSPSRRTSPTSTPSTSPSSPRTRSSPCSCSRRPGDRGSWWRSRCSRRGCKRFWERVRQGLTILRDRRRYFREVFGGAARGLGAFASPPSGSCSRRSAWAAR